MTSLPHCLEILSLNECRFVGIIVCLSADQQQACRTTLRSLVRMSAILYYLSYVYLQINDKLATLPRNP